MQGLQIGSLAQCFVEQIDKRKIGIGRVRRGQRPIQHQPGSLRNACRQLQRNFGFLRIALGVVARDLGFGQRGARAQLIGARYQTRLQAYRDGIQAGRKRRLLLPVSEHLRARCVQGEIGLLDSRHRILQTPVVIQ